MARSTIRDALRDMRRLHPVDAGRLTGIRVYHSFLSRPEQWLADTPPPWRDRLFTAITDRAGGTITRETPEYLVLSDRVVVAMLSVTAQVVLSDLPLSANQAKHQAAAAQVLRDLPRDILGALADQRARWERSDEDADVETVEAGYLGQPGNALRVAPAGDPTDTRWVHIGADLDAAHRTLQEACHADAGADPGQVLIVTAAGYGAYGRDRHSLDLPMLCAMHQVADTHHVTPGTVGDWLAAEGATGTDVHPQTLITDFAATYLGAYPDRAAYTQTRMAQLGWAQAITAAGIPQQHLDLGAMTRDWFRTEVRDVPADGHIEVFTRHRPDREAVTPPTG